MPILIDKVRIYNFRSLKKCSITLEPVTLLIGANDSGKTSFLRALNLVLGVGQKRITPEDFYIGENSTEKSKEIIIDVHIVPTEADGSRIDSFSDEWTEKQFAELINIDAKEKQYFSFRTKVVYDILKGEYSIKRYKIKDWKETEDWEIQKHDEELKQSLDGFPLFFMDAQRDIVQDLRDRNSYFGRLLSKIKIDDELLKEIEERIKAINQSIISGSAELASIKVELQKLKDTVSTGAEIELNPVNERIRDIHRGISISLQDSSSESFSLEYHGMGIRSWATVLTYGAFIAWQYRKMEQENQPYYTILALEEPEAHLHPHAQRTLYKQLSEMKGQKIISTHSPFIASQCQLHELRHFKKQKSYAEIASLDVSIPNEEKRKLRREVFNTRGELLFARAVVLSEGETEEQALPIFAEKHWGKHPYEIGISFVGVGGYGKYAPFLRILQQFSINWFIFSDGESKSIEMVKDALRSVGISTDPMPSNVITIPNNENLEGYLISSGYQVEIRGAIMEYLKSNGEILNDTHLETKRTEVERWTDEELKTYMVKYNTKLSHFYSNNISLLEGERSIPVVVKDLFRSIKL
jgi:putative ATP-dependent endonuclease of OLD family